MGLRAQVRAGQQRLAIGATTDCVLELRDGSAVRMAPSAAQEGQMRGVCRGEKGDFFGHLASTAVGLVPR